MHLMFVLLTPVSRAHCLVDFCGEHVNCSNTLAEEAGLVAVRGLPELPLCTLHTVICVSYLTRMREYLGVLEVLLHIHAYIIVVFPQLYRISNTTSK
jgi:hypothetical protein